MSRSPCNYVPCKHISTLGSRFSYHFPSWLVRRALSASFIRHNIVGIGGSWTISIPKMITDEDPIWRCINYGTAVEVAGLLAQGRVNACDMNKDGKSLLHVRASLSSIGFIRGDRLHILVAVCRSI